MKQIRQIHFYMGTFFAPLIFFFAFSGALQTFGLHESEEGSAYSPPSWIVTLAEIHKDQRLAKPRKPHVHATAAENAETHPGNAPKPDAHDDHEHEESPSSLPLKCFILLLSIGLMTTAAFGIYMALQNRNNRRTTWIMLASGIVVPITLLYL